MPYTPQFIPQPFGNVTVATPGTPVQLTVNLPGLAVTTDATTRVHANKININASPISHAGAGNTGSVYIGSQFMSRATLAGVIAVIPKGSGLSITNNVSMNIYDFHKFYVDADTAGDGVYGSIDTV